MVFLPIFVTLAGAVSFAAGLRIAALMVEYRDFRFIVPFIVQFGHYLSPVWFYSNVVPENWRLLNSLNPMARVIDDLRWALVGGPQTICLPRLLASIFGIALLLTTGIWYFRRTERTFADVI